MSVTPNDIVAYGSQYMPEADGIQVGGAVDCTKRVAFYDISPSGTVDGYRPWLPIQRSKPR